MEEGQDVLDEKIYEYIQCIHSQKEKKIVKSTLW